MDEYTEFPYNINSHPPHQAGALASPLLYVSNDFSETDCRAALPFPA